MSCTVIIDNGGVSSLQVTKSETIKDVDVLVEEDERLLRLDTKKKQVTFKLNYFSLHTSHASKGKLTFRFSKQDIQVMITSTPECIKELIAGVVASQGRQAPAAKRPLQTYAELNIRQTPMKKKLNTFVSPHKPTPTRFSPAVVRPGLQAAGGLSSKQRMVIDKVLQGQSIFFTGGAGTGKSFLLRKLIKLLKPDTTAVTASTGLAACHLNGVTLHHWGGIGIATTGDVTLIVQKIR